MLNEEKSGPELTPEERVAARGDAWAVWRLTHPYRRARNAPDELLGETESERFERAHPLKAAFGRYPAGLKRVDRAPMKFELVALRHPWRFAFFGSAFTGCLAVLNQWGTGGSGRGALLRGVVVAGVTFVLLAISARVILRKRIDKLGWRKYLS